MEDLKDGKEEKPISEKIAKDIVQKMLDYYEIDVDEVQEEKEIKRAIKQGIKRLVKAVRLGRLSFNFDNGIQIIQILKSNSDKITYREIDGKAKMAMSSKEDKDYYGRSYELMGSLSEIGCTGISLLKGVDLGLTEVLGMILLQV